MCVCMFVCDMLFCSSFSKPGILDLFKPAVQKFQKHFDEDIRQLRDHLVSVRHHSL